MSRRKMRPRTDNKLFRVTARKTKKINVSPKMTRGGIIL